MTCIECGKEKPPAKFRTARICKRCHRARLRMAARAARADAHVRLHGHRDQGSSSVVEKPR
jgi:hypothetical protein